MSSFKFGVKEIASIDIHKQTQLTDILIVNGKKFVLSYRVSCNNGKDWWYIVDYEKDGETNQKIISCNISQYDKNSAYTISFNVSEAQKWVLQY